MPDSEFERIAENDVPSKSRDLLRKIVELADDAIIVTDEDQRIVLFNQGAERVFGYTGQEVLGQPLDILLPPKAVQVHRRHMRKFAESPVSGRSMGERQLVFGVRRNGVEFPAEASISKVGSPGNLLFTVILRDVSERMEAVKKIRVSLREKEALLREIHHRVKNNLQIVASLLALEARGTSDELTRKMFEESQNRIHSMSLLHETLYRSNDLSQIAFPEYIRELTAHLFRSYGILHDRIRLRLDLDDLGLHIDSAVPCGLIVNELASNALKHAFPDGRPGEVRIELRRLESGLVELVVADDGIGMSGDIAQAKSLGLRLVRTLAEQLSAKLEFSSPPGTAVKLTFPLPD